MRRRITLLFAGTLLAAACSGDGSTTPTRPSTVDGQVAGGPAALTDHSVVSSPAGWERIELTFDLPDNLDAQTRQDIDEGWNAISIERVRWAGGAYLAIGEAAGQPTIWRSDDLVGFDVAWSPSHDDGCCRRHVRLEHILDLGDRALVGAVGSEDGVDRSFVFASDDVGESWTEVDADVFAAAGARLSQLVSVEGTAIATVGQVVDNRYRPGVGYRSDDLVSWTPVAAIDAGVDPSGEPYGVRYVGGGSLAAWTFGWTAEGGFTRVWRSDDVGETFEPSGDYPAATGRRLVPVGEALVTSADESEYRYWWGEGEMLADPGRPLVFDDGETRRLEANAGLWGDGRFSFIDTTTRDGTTWAIISRTHRSNPHFCVDDVTTCQQHEAGLVHSDDAANWVDVALPDDARGARWLAVGDRGDVAVVGIERQPRVDGQVIVAHVHYGPDRPDSTVPDHYDPPVAPVDFWDGEGLAVGERARYAWGLGGCGGFWLDDVEWVAEEPVSDAVPVLVVEIADGPSRYVFGEMLLVDETTIEFSVQEEVVAVLHPRAEERTEFCG